MSRHALFFSWAKGTYHRYAIIFHKNWGVFFVARILRRARRGLGSDDADVEALACIVSGGETRGVAGHEMAR